MIIRGFVQGVFFRVTIRRLALDHGVSGWVANAGDGSVEAAFEGEPGAVEAMLRFSRQGPDYAAVESVEVFEEEPVGEDSFEIR